MSDVKDDLMQTALAAVLTDKDLTLTALPKLDLYMDQIISLFQGELSTDGEKDKILTKTMINNYSKEGLLISIKGKKYSPSHVLMMQLIYNLKQVLSINDIKVLFDSAAGELVAEDGKSYNEDKVFALTDDFLRNKGTIRSQLLESVDGLNEAIRLSEPSNRSAAEDRLAKVLVLATISDYARRAAEYLIREAGSEE